MAHSGATKIDKSNTSDIFVVLFSIKIQKIVFDEKML